MKIEVFEIFFNFCVLYCNQIKTNEKHAKNEFSNPAKYPNS